MSYRTHEQFQEIVENCINGNWQDAGRNCIEYGFYANDLIKANEEGIYPTFEEDTDIAIVIEIATRLRYE